MRSEVPFQRVADSPTVKYYVDWAAFEPFLEDPAPATGSAVDGRLLELLGIGVDVELGLEGGGPAAGAGWEAEALRLMEFHRGNLSLWRELRVDGALAVLVRKPVGGTKSSHLRLLLGDGARAAVLLLSPADARGLHTLTLDVEVEPEAEASLLLVAFDSLEAPGFTAQRVSVGEGAQFTQLTVVGRGRMAYLEQSCALGRGASLRLLGALAAPRGSRVALVTNVGVNEPRAAARVEVVGFAAGGTLVHKGVAWAGVGAVESSLSISSRLTPLDGDARVYAAPMLEIRSNSVAEASHSASHAPVSEDALFYLRARGIPEREALRMIVEGSYRGLLEGAPGAEAALRLLPAIVESLTAGAPPPGEG